MTNFETYVKPELLIVAAALYVLGMIIKNTQKIDNKFIPSILGIVGVGVSLLYVISTEGFNGIAVFTAITQGILTAGVAVYANQLIKQSSK